MGPLDHALADMDYRTQRPRKHVQKIVWKKGPPPHVGWWNASAYHYSSAWRWWDGKQWSIVFYPEEPLSKNRLAHPPASAMARGRIQWNDGYPANARVPRINPGAGA